jgi:hypothetical protein
VKNGQEEQEMMKQEVAQTRWMTQRAQGYVSGWKNVAISEGGANVGRIILRKQGKNLNVIDQKQKGG